MAHPLLEALTPVAEAVGGEVLSPSDLAEGDIPLSWDGEVVGGFRLPGLHGALQRLIGNLEREMGAPLSELAREDKQRAVHQLDQAGAFMLRKAVEEVADALGVSRFTVYNYLNSTEE
ncbi:MAG: helix-turn-helix domain-containing protein [Acidimicrobiales bacterium]